LGSRFRKQLARLGERELSFDCSLLGVPEQALLLVDDFHLLEQTGAE
jgi:hypothetical protein